MVCRFESRPESAWVQLPTAETRSDALSDAREGLGEEGYACIVPLPVGGSRQTGATITPRQVPLSKNNAIANAVLALVAEAPGRFRGRGLASRREAPGSVVNILFITRESPLAGRAENKACVNAPLAGAREAGHISWFVAVNPGGGSTPPRGLRHHAGSVK